MPDNKATPPPGKSKQERIRDNQRRSRARRQEYLADLERRLSECQMTCRDADIQKAAFLEIQIENARLRELLSLSGVNEDFIDNYVSQALAQSGQFPRETNCSLRQIKPKIEGIASTRPHLNGIQHTESRKSSMTPNASTSPIDLSVGSSAASSYVTTGSYTSGIPTITDMPSSNSFDWLYQQPHGTMNHSDAGDLSCSPLQMTLRADARVADDATVLCSVAKQMIAQYNIPPRELEQVQAKLAQGLCRPAYPGAGCSVDNQTLFNVLSELMTRYS